MEINTKTVIKYHEMRYKFIFFIHFSLVVLLTNASYHAVLNAYFELYDVHHI